VNATGARPPQRNRCPCQRVFQVFGQGRHRRFYEVDDLHWKSPAMARACSSCERRLPTTRGLLAPEMRP
jgi:hypothetical protein